jgi:hypothetical protein
VVAGPCRRCRTSRGQVRSNQAKLLGLE